MSSSFAASFTVNEAAKELLFDKGYDEEEYGAGTASPAEPDQKDKMAEDFRWKDQKAVWASCVADFRFAVKRSGCQRKTTAPKKQQVSRQTRNQINCEHAPFVKN